MRALTGSCLFVGGVGAVHIAVAAPPLGHAVTVAAGELVLAVAVTAVGASTYDVSTLFRISRNLSVQLVRQIEQSLNTLSADVISTCSPGRAVVLVAAVAAIVLLVAKPPLLDALAVGAGELGGGARLI